VFVGVYDVNKGANVVAVGYADWCILRLQLQPLTQAGLAERLVPRRKFANGFDD
jgi:hypothetical protein